MISRNIAKTFNNLFIKNIYFRAASKSSKDLYQILGVNKNSDPKQIKKAYYKLAQQHHPDKNSSPGAKQKFAQINNAYQVLSDPQKKQMYDQTGSTESFDQGQGFSQQDIFNQFKGGFQGMNMGGGMGGFQDILNEMFGGGSKKGRKNQRQASVMNMSIDFMESVNGATKTVQFTKQITCQNCNGSKCKPGTSPIKCNTCNGTGAQTIRQGMFIMNTMCNSCMGEGSKIKQFCSGCKGTGVQKKNVKQQVQIPRGISDGQTIKLSKKGNFNGDLLIKVSVRKNNKFIRDGNNVKTDLQISPIDAILGCKKQINTIYNTKAQVNIQPGSQYGQNIDILGEGFYMRGSNQKGKHIITLKIVIPKQITSEEKAIYEQLKKVQQVV